MSVSTPTVFIVDQDAAVRHSLGMVIEAAGWQSESFATTREFLARPRPRAASCLVLDVALPDLDSLALQQRLAWERPDIAVVMITGQGDIPTTVRAMKAGAVEFLTKPLSREGVLRAVGEGVERSTAVLAREAAVAQLRQCYGALSLRERQVMSLVVAGHLNKQVAGRLGISEVTVKAHRGQVMRKMGADSLADLVTMALRLGHSTEEGKQPAGERYQGPMAPSGGFARFSLVSARPESAQAWR